MEKKYQTRKEELAEAMLQNSVRDALVVDERLIRRKYLAEANDIINKIEIPEIKIQLFHLSDQQRFDAWHTLTFRDDLHLIERAQSEFRKLVEFHNWVVAAARTLDTELSEAFILIQQEQRRYQDGTHEERQKVELDRRMRNAFIDADSGARYTAIYLL